MKSNQRSHSRRLLLRIAIVAASAVTLLFGLSTIFCFGISTHRMNSLGWSSSTSNADLVQVICVRGQFHVAVNFARDVRRPPSEPRKWHAGVRFFPDLRLDVHV